MRGSRLDLCGSQNFFARGLDFFCVFCYTRSLSPQVQKALVGHKEMEQGISSALVGHKEIEQGTTRHYQYKLILHYCYKTQTILFSHICYKTHIFTSFSTGYTILLGNKYRQYTILSLCLRVSSISSQTK